MATNQISTPKGSSSLDYKKLIARNKLAKVNRLLNERGLNKVIKITSINGISISEL